MAMLNYQMVIDLPFTDGLYHPFMIILGMFGCIRFTTSHGRVFWENDVYKWRYDCDIMGYLKQHFGGYPMENGKERSLVAGLDRPIPLVMC